MPADFFLSLASYSLPPVIIRADRVTRLSRAILGSDLRESCRSHTPLRYRFAYNGIYSEQVRTYEINGLSDDGVGMIDAEVLSAELSPSFLSNFPNWPWSRARWHS